jgi:Uma2 family endonuclease
MSRKPKAEVAPATERRILRPNVHHLIIEDGKPVDNPFAEKQQRLLTEPLYSCWIAPRRRPFVVMANVGLFFEPKNNPLAPDTMLALDVVQDDDFTRKENRTYFVWTRGKPPDVVIEIVSDRRGREDTTKLLRYQKGEVPFYVVFDPDNILRGGELRAFALRDGIYVPSSSRLFKGIGLGLMMWEGEFEFRHDRWLRWFDSKGRPIPTGKERADAERDRADAAQRRVERLAARLRELGVDPEV